MDNVSGGCSVIRFNFDTCPVLHTKPHISSQNSDTVTIPHIFCFCFYFLETIDFVAMFTSII